MTENVLKIKKEQPLNKNALKNNLKSSHLEAKTEITQISHTSPFFRVPLNIIELQNQDSVKHWFLLNQDFRVKL